MMSSRRFLYCAAFIIASALAHAQEKCTTVSVFDTNYVKDIGIGYEFKDGLPDGMWVASMSKSPKAYRKVVLVGCFRAGRRHGQFTYYDLNNTKNMLREENYFEGLKQGAYRMYNDGVIQTEGCFYGGMRNGLWRHSGERWESRTKDNSYFVRYIESEIYYRMDTLVLYSQYYSDGGKKIEVIYDATGRAESAARYGRDGDIIAFVRFDLQGGKGEVRYENQERYGQFTYSGDLRSILSEDFILQLCQTSGVVVLRFPDGQVVERDVESLECVH